MGEQEEPTIKTSPYSTPQYNYGSAIISLTNPEEQLNQFKLSMQGRSINSRGEEVQEFEPWMNEQGVQRVYSLTKSMVNQITIFSGYKEVFINNFMMGNSDVLIQDLMINSKKYDIKNPTTRDIILQGFSNIMMSTIQRANQDQISDKHFWRGSTQEITMRQEQGQQKKQGVLGSILGWGQKK